MSNQTRPLTALEKHHARTVYLRVVFFKWLLVLLGSFFLVLSVILPVAFVMDDIRAPVLLIGFLIVLDLVVAVLGVLCIAHGLGRVTTLRHTTTQVRGRLIEEKRTASAGNGGGRYTVYTYFIDDVQLSWPPGAERLYKPLIDHTITLTVAMIDIKSRPRLKAFVKCFGIDPNKEKSRGLGVVLKCQRVINVHGVLETYGRYYLLRYQFQVAVVIGLSVTLALLPTLHPDSTDWLIRQSHFVQLLIIAGCVIGSGVVTFFTVKGYQALRKLLNPAYDDTPHEEKLKG
ncbi:MULTISPECIES: hypothetical protein [unclassified Halomonas]|uniref:hypothetical protein n=1 Tax=unclassified Halomonas TaxID=2609666 RepID=UPI002076832E|nr:MULTISPECIES: hypothetical protein [unclassified Halomonas]